MTTSANAGALLEQVGGGQDNRTTFYSATATGNQDAL